MTREADEKVNWTASIPFLLAHFIPLLALVTGVTVKALVLAGLFYAVRMFAITAGYHRYFAHRSFKTNRVVQFALAFVGTMAAQKGPLWWAGHHRGHHRYADTERDIHSPQRGFWWSHVGWILCDKYKATDFDAIRDLAKYPELRFLDRYNAIGPFSLGALAFVAGGWSGLVVGFFASTVVLWHVTFTINSLSHTLGTRRYATTETSRNNPVLALLTFGEGWHNNHHHYQASARQGFFWWEYDLSWYALRVLALFRVVRDLRRPTPVALAADRIRDGAFDLGMFAAAWRRAGTAVSRSRAELAQSVGAGQAAIEAALHAKREALEAAVAASLRSAEDLTRTAKRAARGLPV
jgi:stearoyl-CoA desaturase (delta-9 desaturase)